MPQSVFAYYSMLCLVHTKDIFVINTMCKELKNKLLVDFGEKIRHMRKSKGFSQEELAYKANLHRTYIGMIERAEKNISLINIQKIAISLESSIEELLNGIENK